MPGRFFGKSPAEEVVQSCYSGKMQLQLLVVDEERQQALAMAARKAEVRGSLSKTPNEAQCRAVKKQLCFAPSACNVSTLGC